MPDANLSTASRVLDIEFANKFEQGVTALMTVFGIETPQTLTAGTQIQMYTVEGALSEGEVTPGAEIPLSKYEQKKVGDPYAVTLKPYRKATTKQDILKYGFEAAVEKTDNKMIKDIQGGLRKDFFAFLAAGTGTATGTTFQAALANTWGVLTNTLNEKDESGTPVFFVNPLDVAEYLGGATVNNVETAFGFIYLKNFLGIGDAILDANVGKGTVIATPKENINVYVVDFDALSEAGFSYQFDESGFIGVHHEPVYKNGTAETYADTGVLLFPEVANYIVKATIEKAI